MVSISMFLFSLAGLGQDGALKLFVKPGGDFFIQVDGSEPQQAHILNLSDGEHHLAVWSYGYEVMDTVLTVVANETTKVYLELSKSPAYQEHERLANKYQKQKVAYQVYTSGFLAASAIATTIFYVRQNGQFNEFESLSKDYRNSTDPQEILKLKGELEEVSDNQQRNLRYFQVGVPVTIVAAGLTYWGFRKSAGMEQPVYNDPNRLRFQGVSFTPDGIPALGMTFKF